MAQRIAKWTISKTQLLSLGLLGLSLLSNAQAAPTVTLSSPANNAVVAAPGTVNIAARVTASSGTTISNVQFYQGAALVGTATASPYTVTWSNAPAGVYSLTAKATDSKGAVTTSAAIAVTVDTPPTVSLTAPAAGQIFTAPAKVTLSADAADGDGTVAKVVFYHGATVIGTATKSPYTVTWANAAAGSYSLTAVATDNKGITTTSAAVPLVVLTPPTVSLADPVPPAGQSVFTAPASIPLSATASDANASITQVDFYRSNTLIGTASSAPYAITWANAAAGAYNLTAKVTNSNGATVTSPVVRLVVNAAPTVNLTTPKANQVFLAGSSVPITASAADRDGTVVKVDYYQGSTLLGTVTPNTPTGTASPYTFNWDNAPAGSYSLTAVATDNQGGVTVSRPIAIVVDTPPTVSLTAPTANQQFTAPARITLTADAADSDGTVARVQFYQGTTLIGTVSKAPYSISWNNTQVGDFILTARAIDNRGVIVTSAEVPVRFVPNVAPSIALSSPGAGQTYNAPASIVLSATAADTDGNVAKVAFYQGSTLIATVSKPPYSHTWTRVPAGAYSLTAVATDNLGAVTVSDPVSILVNAPPTVTLTSPTAGQRYPASPATVSLSATAADSDGTVDHVDFYQGNTLVGTANTPPYTATWHNAPAGSYRLTAKATDNSGAVTTSAAVNIAIASNTAPTISLSSPTLNQVYTAPAATIVLSATAADPNGKIARVDFYQGSTLLGSKTSAPYSYTWSNVPAGSYSLTAIATDNQGASTTSPAVPVLVNAPPTISLVAPKASQTYTAPGPITITADASDVDDSIAKIDFYQGNTLIGSLDTRSGGNTPYSYIWNNVAAGSYTITAVATDSNGAASTSAPLTITVNPNQPPTVSLASPSVGQSFNAPASIPLAVTATDSDGSIVKVDYYQGSTLIGTATTAPFSYTWNNAPAGSYQITAKATDNGGATTTSTALTIQINAPPTVTLSAPTPTAGNGLIAPTSLNLSATAADSDGSIAKVDFYQDGTWIGTASQGTAGQGSAASAPYTLVWSNVAAGTYSLTAQATDNSGAVTTSSAQSITIAVNQPPTVTLSSPTGSQSFKAPASITITANAADSDGTIAKVDFYQGGTLLGSATTAPYSYTWSNVTAGTYSLTAQATDNLGATTTSPAQAVTVAANQPPTVSLSSPTSSQSYKAPASITLTANAADSDGTIAKVDFYQGSTLLGSATAAPFSYTWSNVTAGTYSLTAQATDDQGAATTSTAVSVTVQSGDLQPYYIESDHLNTPRLITDGNKNPVWKWDNTDPFGANAPDQDPQQTGSVFEFNLRFAGQYYDSETGLFYNGFRTYNPGTGRYLESDPIGLDGGLNTYAYVDGNPLNSIDPLGLAKHIIFTTEGHPENGPDPWGKAAQAAKKEALKSCGCSENDIQRYNVNSVSQVQNILSSTKDIGSVYFIGHSGWDSIYVGASPTPNTNISLLPGPKNVDPNSMDWSNLNKNAEIHIWGCNSSRIAQDLADASRRPATGFSGFVNFDNSTGLPFVRWYKTGGPTRATPRSQGK